MNRNKKVKNAQKCKVDNVIFKSKLEKYCYDELKKNNFNVSYEPFKVILLPGFYPEQISIYQPIKLRKIKKYIFNKTNKKILDVTYTPDFFINLNNKKIFIETKGKPNETYPLKKKLFLHKLCEDYKKNKNIYYFFEPHNMSQVDEMIEILKKLENDKE